MAACICAYFETWIFHFLALSRTWRKVQKTSSFSMAFDELLQHVGDSGRFQIWNIVLCILLNIMSRSHMFVENFSAAIPAHRCYVQLLDSPIPETNVTLNMTAEVLLRVSIPMDSNHKPEQCRRFRQTQWQLLDANVSATNMTELETEPCLDGWIYDQSVFKSTIITEWDLVCDFRLMKSLSQAIYMTGLLMSVFTGIVSDRAGRRPVLLLSCLLSGAIGTCCSFAPTFPTYCVLRFLMAAFVSTIENASIVFGVEWSNSKRRPTIVAAVGFAWSTGQVLLGGLAYVFPDRHMIQLFISVPYFVCFLFLCGNVESARWLIATGKTERALKELRKVAWINGKKDIAESLTIEILRSTMKEEEEPVRKHFTAMEIILNPLIRRTVFFFIILSFSTTLILVGLLLNLESLGTNLFLNQVLLGVVDFPVRVLSYFVIRHVNRRPSIMVSLFLSGSPMLVNLFVPREMSMVRLLLGMLAKASISTLFILCIVFQSEISATTLRSTFQSFVLFGSRLAALLGVLVLITRQYSTYIPVVIYDTFLLVSGICVYFLPETWNLPLPETVEDMEKRNRIRRNQSRHREDHHVLRSLRNSTPEGTS